MPRTARASVGGICYHVINRGNARDKVFHDAEDYAAFVRLLGEAAQRVRVRVLAYCLMPNHFHLVLWPREDGQLSRFMQWLTMTHTQRWHAHRHDAGRGHLYQSRFKSFPIQRDGHFLSVCRYVERNPLRARLVKRADDWTWGSLAWRKRKRREVESLLDNWPVERPRNWTRLVNEAQSADELEALNRCVRRGQPYGEAAWVRRTAVALGLESTLRPVGRPKRRQET